MYRIKKYTNEQLEDAFDVQVIHYYKEPKKQGEFGDFIIEEIFYFREYLLIHISWEDEEKPPILQCGEIYYNNIAEYVFDLDNDSLTLSFIDSPATLDLFGTVDELEFFYQKITLFDEKFILTDFSELNELFEEAKGNIADNKSNDINSNKQKLEKDDSDDDGDLELI